MKLVQVLSFTVLLFASCKNQIKDVYFSDDIRIYDSNEINISKLEGKLLLNDLIGIGNIEVIGEHLLLTTSDSDSLFNVYSLNGQFKSAFGVTGQGPNDFGTIWMNGCKEKVGNQEFIWINDVNSSLLKKLNLTESVQNNLCKVDTTVSTLPMCINSFYIEPSRVIQESMKPDNFELTIRRDENTTTEKMYKIETSHPFSMYKSTMRIDYPLLVSSMVSINQINMLDLSNGKRFTICIGEYINVDDVLDKGSNTEKWTYYVDLRLTKNYIFALYMNQNYKDSYVKDKGVEIHVFDKRGAPLRIIHVDEYLKNFCITEDETQMYGLKGDHTIYQYQLIL